VVEVPACPDGCWIVLGEGFNTAWEATADGEALGEPELVDGNANGWYLEPSTRSRTVTMTWTAQRPVTIALALSALAVLALLAIALFDRRRETDAAGTGPPPRLVPFGRPWGRSTALVTVIATIGTSALLIGWSQALIGALVLIPAVISGRSRIVGWTGLSIVLGVGAVVTAVVYSERPFPNAGWPVRFDWLHGWTLLGVLMITCATLLADDARHQPPPPPPST
jgi:arabinofuranan 3-O-arabinosyltransferase